MSPMQGTAQATAGVTLVKLGGSLLTDKRRPETDRPQVIARLAREIASAIPSLDGELVIGHGSGSFGHVAAARHRVQDGLHGSEQRIGLSLTQRRAAELHRRVVEALAEALAPVGTAPFSIAPSSALVTAGGFPASLALEPLVRALDAGLVPTVYGDVVMDLEQGCAICSTETVFEALVEDLPMYGREVSRILWAGETSGVWDAQGETIPRLTPDTLGEALAAAEGAAGTDVTGGMRHRVETVLDLARLGVRSWIGDGREPGRLERALAGDETVPGTWVVPDDLGAPTEAGSEASDRIP